MAALAKSAPQAVQHIHFPNESPQYRRARNALLEPPPRSSAWPPSVRHCRRARHNDLLDPIWNMFDLAPEGRGDFQPKLDYTSGSRN